jgi:DNA-binding MarR family transcriptional regulator
MRSKRELESEVLRALAESGIGTILFRNALAKRLGITLTESLCLTILGTRRVSTPTEIARFTGLASGSTTTMLDRLERRGFVERKPNPEDRRSVIVRIDERYSRIAQELVAGVRKAHRDLIASYSEDELEVICDFLNRNAANLTAHSNRIGSGSTEPAIRDD